MPGRPYLLSETTWKAVRDAEVGTAVLPWGATEAHNLHLPYGTDTMQTEHLAAEAARLSWERGGRVLVLPAVPFGVNTGQLDIRGDINMMPSTQFAVLRDVADSLSRQGFRKLVVLNGHGGNDFRPMLRELLPVFPRLFCCAVNWYAVLPLKDYFENPGEHGDEMETSNLLAVAPGLVLPLTEAGPGDRRPFRVKGLTDGTAWAPRQWSKAAPDTGVGNPSLASADKGRRFLAALAERLGAFLADLALADPDALYGEESS
jgi:creatinine amidohydrolase